MLALSMALAALLAAPALAQEAGDTAPDVEAVESAAPKMVDAEAPASVDDAAADGDAEPDDAAAEAAAPEKDVIVIGAAAAEENLWVLLDGQAETGKQAFMRLKHRGGRDNPELIREPGPMTGHILPGGLAAGGDRLWLVYSGSAATQIERSADSSATSVGQAASTTDETLGRWLLIQSIRAEWLNQQLQYTYDLEAAPPLPARIELLAMAADRRAPWIMLKPQSSAAQTWLQSLEGGAAVNAAPTSADAEEPANETAADSEATEPAHALPGARPCLVTLRARSWQVVPLPEGLDPDAQMRLAMVGSDPVVPTIVSRNGAQFTVYRPAPADRDNLLAGVAWTTRTYELQGDFESWHAIAVEGQLVIGVQAATDPDATSLSVALHVLRAEGALPIGTVTLDVPATNSWNLVSLNRAATLIAGHKADLHWSRMDLEGNAVGEAGLLKPRDIQPISEVIDWIMIALTVIVFALAMLVVMRRDPRGQKLELPADTMIADLSPRAAALFIDLVPCFGLALFVFNIDDPIRMLVNWSRDASYETLFATLLTLGLFAGHTMIAELFTGRSLGKWLIGLRVVTTAGGKPAIWQIVVRNLTKILELLLGPLLLFVPVIMPTRQRLGDVIARTLVVTSAPPVADENAGSNSDEPDDKTKK